MFLKSAVLVLLGVSSSFAMPANGKSENKKINLVKVKPGLKHKLLDEALLKESLERPIDNLVEPEYPDFDASHLLDPTLTGLTAPAPRPVLPSADLEAPVSADVFPIREGFATGHTIPLEILERIAGHNSRYVDSSAFRWVTSKPYLQ